jgi:glycosyltransferase involved in cell wall biosynthesis
LYLCLYLWIKNYSVIHLIGQNQRFAIIHFFFRKKIVQTFHEYAQHSQLERNLNYENWLSHLPGKVIFHSQYVRSFFNEGRNQKVSIIPLSLYETFLYSNEEECFDIGKNAVTIIGLIRPYKGIQLFIDAVNILLDKGINILPVIAGKGDLSQYSIKNKEKIRIINHELSDSEFCEIIKKSSIVVCPYLSASQSGVPMVAHLFDKPVVATRVGAFPEYIHDNRLLVDLNPEHLAATIEELLTNTDFYKEAVSGQKQYYLKSGTWKEIAQRTIAFYNS